MNSTVAEFRWQWVAGDSLASINASSFYGPLDIAW
jgi:hypothetical protein